MHTCKILNYNGGINACQMPVKIINFSLYPKLQRCYKMKDEMLLNICKHIHKENKHNACVYTHERMRDNNHGLILHANYSAQTLHANNEQQPHLPLIFII